MAGPHERLELRMVPTGAGEPYTLPRGPITRVFWGYLSPDEKHVVTLGAQAGGPERYWVQEIPGGTPRPFGPDEINAHFRAASTPDGRWWIGRPPGPLAPFVLYSIDGGEPRHIPGLKVEDQPFRWSDDGHWLYSTTPPFRLPIEVTRIDMRTGHREPWLRLAPPDMVGVNGSGAALSTLTPDGRYYGYNYTRSLSDLYLATNVR
jgi:hypothetical protein